MSLRFIFGGAGSGKSTYVREEVLRESMQFPEKQFFLIVPDQFTMAAQKAMVEAHPNKVIMNIDVQSFSRLCYRIFEEVGKKELLAIDDTGKNLVLRKVARDLQREDKLPVLGTSMERIGCLHEVKSVLSEFMQYGMTVEDVGRLQTYAQGRSALAGKLADLQTLYAAFLEALSEKYVTGEERLSMLAGLVPKSELLKDSVIYLDGFTGFTPVQRQVIRAFLSCAEDVVVTLTISGIEAKRLLSGKETADTDLFYLTKNSYASLVKLAVLDKISRGEDVVLDGECVKRYSGNPSLAFLEKNLFRKEKASFEGTPENIQIAVLPSPRDEISYLCREIRRLVKEAQYAYRDIAVVTGDVARYRAAAIERFSACQIPLFMDQGAGITLNPFMEYVLSGMDVILTDFSYDSVMRFLKSGLTGLSRKEVDLLAQYMKSRNIRGRKKWSAMFTKGFYENSELMQEVNRLRAIVFDLFMPLLEIPFSVGKEKTEDAAVLTEHLYAFIEKSDLERKLQARVAYFEAEKDFARKKEYEQIYGYMMEVLSQIHELLAGEPMSLAEYKEMVEAGASEMEIGIIPGTVDYVQFGDIERTRLSQVKVLFFLGVNDGIIPKNVSGTGLLSDLEREFFREGGFELSPTPREKMIQQRLYLYMNVCTPTEKLYLSYSVADMEGKEVRPSYLVEVFERLFPALSKRRPMQEPEISRITSDLDARESFAHLVCDYAAGLLENERCKEEKELLTALYQLQKEQFKPLLEGAFYSYHSFPLAKELVTALFGRDLSISVSRLEGYAACAYRHFLKYGLGLAAETDSRFDVQDLGNFFHGVLEKFGMRLQEVGKDWAGITREEAAEILHDITRDEAIRYEDAVLYQDASTAYQVERMERILLRTVESVGYQIAKGAFRKMKFEVSMKRTQKLEDLEDVSVTLRGKIDRMDIAETDDKIYVRIVDYKSGDKKIDLVKVYDGQQLQLAVYMDEALQLVRKENEGKEVAPAGMFYYHIQDPFQDDDSLSYEEWIRKELRLSGLITEEEAAYTLLDRDMAVGGAKSDVVHLSMKKDGAPSGTSQIPKEQSFGEVIEVAKKRCEEHVRGILSGEKSAKPYDAMTCTYCDYREVCDFNIRVHGYSRQK